MLIEYDCVFIKVYYVVFVEIGGYDIYMFLFVGDFNFLKVICGVWIVIFELMVKEIFF